MMECLKAIQYTAKHLELSLDTEKKKKNTDKRYCYNDLSRRLTKATKSHVRPAKTQISLGPLWVAKDPRLLHADSKDS